MADHKITFDSRKSSLINVPSQTARYSIQNGDLPYRTLKLSDLPEISKDVSVGLPHADTGSDVMLRPSVLGQDRSQTNKSVRVFVMQVLCCETRSCHARRHNDLEGHSNFSISSTIYSFSILQYILQDFCFGGVMDKLGVQDFRSA